MLLPMALFPSFLMAESYSIVYMYHIFFRKDGLFNTWCRCLGRPHAEEVDLTKPHILQRIIQNGS